ncbi:MAG TPA: DUF4252 domain-containing protein [Pyrinomonadaceae bacterium]|nr:DUF4252 domain-containing protein [Pyrinomonadaceae bacterium]
MKSVCTKSLKLASVAFVLILGSVVTAYGQNPRIQTTQLDALTAKASQTIDVNLDERLMQMAAKFLSNKDPEEASVKDLVAGLKGIYVKSFEFEKEGEFVAADLESIRSQLRNPAWSKIVNVTSKKEGNVEVYLMTVGGQISSLAVLADGPKEITIVNILGPVNLEKLSQLEGQFGVPELGIESKPKRKN